MPTAPGTSRQNPRGDPAVSTATGRPAVQGALFPSVRRCPDLRSGFPRRSRGCRPASVRGAVVETERHRTGENGGGGLHSGGVWGYFVKRTSSVHGLSRGSCYLAVTGRAGALARAGGDAETLEWVRGRTRRQSSKTGPRRPDKLHVPIECSR